MRRGLRRSASFILVQHPLHGLLHLPFSTWSWYRTYNACFHTKQRPHPPVGTVYTGVAHTMAPHPQDAVLEHSLRDPETFWAHHAEQLHWHKRPTRTLARTTKTLPSGTSHQHWSWFPDGEISTTYNCVDRHVKNGNGDNVAIIWESPATKSKQTITYSQLLEEVEVLAGVLREEGVRKGDVVLIYSMVLIFSPCILYVCSVP